MKIICVGRNYVDHAKELNNPVPKQPLLFMKPSTALLLEEKPFYYPEFSNEIHYELELVLRIVKNGRHVQPKFARGYYEQLALGIDFTARDIQRKCKEKGHPWEKAKGFDHSACLSRFIDFPVPGKEGINFRLLKNSQEVQTGNSNDMIFDFDYLIQDISKYFKLQIGDLIYTGTPAGVGPVTIGDLLEGYVNGQKLLHCEIK